MENAPFIFMLLLCISCIQCCFSFNPMVCNPFLSSSCPASLYFAPVDHKTKNETASLFHVDTRTIRETIDGFIISVNCSCPVDHGEYIWHTIYTVQHGDTWQNIALNFGSLILQKPEKKLISSMVITMDLLCGCYNLTQLVTYAVKDGDTLFTICSQFGADINLTVELNNMTTLEVIHVGDIIFLPASGLQSLLDQKGSNARKRSKPSNHVVEIIAALIGLISLTVLVLWIFYCKRKGCRQLEATGRGFKTSPCRRTTSLNTSISAVTSHSSTTESSIVDVFSPHKATVFSYLEICDATLSFNPLQKIGQGSYGSVYLGRLKDSDVAIKQMKSTKSKEFLAELNILCKVHHTNLIGLIGYAAGGESLFLVYEFAQNGSLSDHLHDPGVKGHKPLSWFTRVQIAVDAAKGLEYIHMHAKAYYVHRDVKTSNILLDAKYRAKIADFGLVKLLDQPEAGAATTKIVGTFGYLAPEYVRDGYVTPMCDVYAFGVVLMELITGKPALSRFPVSENAEQTEHRSLINLMLSAFENESDPMGTLERCVDPNLIKYHKDSLIQLLKIAILAKECVTDEWSRRPDMSKVVLRLSNIHERCTSNV